MRKINARGLGLIKGFEGCRLTAYRDAVGVWTVGYGHTSMAGPPDVKPGLRISAYEAEEMLARDLSKYESAVARLVKVPLTDNQFAALTSFCFNVGPGALEKSTLLKHLNRGDYEDAQAQFGKWIRAGSRVLSGLVRRRAAEAALFALPGLSVAWGDTPPPYLPPDVPRPSSRSFKPPSGGFFNWLKKLIGKGR